MLSSSKSTPSLARVSSVKRLITMKDLDAPEVDKPPAPKKSAPKKLHRPNSLSNFKRPVKKGHIDATKQVDRYLRGKSNIWVKKKS